MLQALLVSDDVRSLTLLVGSCVVGFLVTWPSPALVRVLAVGAATMGIAAWILTSHDAEVDAGQKTHSQASTLYQRGGGGGARQTTLLGPHALLIHPDAASAIASLAQLSRPGRRTAVHSVVVATEGVVQAYHSVLDAPARSSMHPASAGTDDLRDATIVALDALQALRMETGSRGRASCIAASAERRLRRLFVRFRQIAGNKLKTPNLYGTPFPFDPSDDHRCLR